MMRPPERVLAGSTRLDLAGFSEHFTAAWSATRSRFLKLECWQSYRESATNGSQDMYERGRVQDAQRLLRDEAEADRPLYEEVRARGIEYARIRLVQEPLTPYLRYEMLSYQIRSEMGENIEIVRHPRGQMLPSDEYFDFLLFDRAVALIHDYGTTGLQQGGWVTRSSDVIRSLEETAAALRESAVPLKHFLIQCSS